MGGGGSFLASSFTNPLLSAGVRSGDGYVTIDPVTTPVPEPGSFALLDTGLLGLGLIGRRRRRS
ncbi:MAG: PEP-CTERM sorting domain-containing protein [Acetobacteraceae bacterium]